MKNIKFLSFLMIATSLLFIQCTTDPIPGPDGHDGVDGIDGTDGVNGTTECAVCHNVTTSEEVHSSYLYSQHAAGETVSYAGGRASCAQCHSNEGYVDFATTGVTTDYDNPTAISCTTCHDMHTTFDFENDGYDYALRLPGAVTLITDESYSINYENGSNTCANCHQPRRTGPVDNGMGLYEQTSSHWGPHHGPQATLLEGIQGMEIAGSIEYPAPMSAGHRTGTSCTECHMGEPGAGIDGLHTWRPTNSACTTCHSNGIPEEVTGLDATMAALLVILEEEGILHEDENGEVHPVVGTFPILTAEAAWNYLLIMEDKSNGLHNPKYSTALLENSLEALNAD